MRETELPLSLAQLSRWLVRTEETIHFHAPFCGGRTLAHTFQHEHWRRIRDHHILLVVQSGEIIITQGEDLIHLGGGGAFYLSPDARPDVYFQSGTMYHECYFRPESEPLCTPAVATTQGADDLVHPLHVLGDLIQTDGDPWSAKLWLATAIDTFAHHQRKASDTDGHQGTGLSAHQRKLLMTWVQTEIRYAPGPADLARHLQLSPDYFARLFRATYGISPRQWLAEQRIREAIRLLEHTTMTVNEIARDLNYSDAVHFCRKFKAVTGLTPLTYRRQSLPD